MTDTIYNKSCLDMSELDDNSIDCCVTSPPYWGLRDYQTATWDGGDPECNHNPQKPDGGERADRAIPLGRGGVYKDICGICGAVRIDSQIGLEKTPELYVEKMVTVFSEVKRVLKPEGTLWLNLGDTYSAHKDCKSVPDSLRVGGNSETANDISKGMSCSRNSKMLKEIGLKNKDLVGIS